MQKRKSLKAICYISILFMAISLTGASCGNSTTSVPTQSPTATSSTTSNAQNLTNVATTVASASFDANYKLAQDKAKIWKSDAELVYVSVKLPISLEVGNTTTSFTFGSKSDADNWWNISISEKTGKYIRAIIPKADYLGTAQKTVDTSFWKINYLEAFQIAEKNGGQAFRQANQDVEATVTLAKSDPKGWTWWLVEYKTPTGSITKVRINPGDKSVVDDTGNVVSTSTNSNTTTTNNNNNTNQK